MTEINPSAKGAAAGGPKPQAPRAAEPAPKAAARPRDHMSLSGPLPGPAERPTPAELATLRLIRDHAVVVLDQGARDGAYVPTDWLTDAARGIQAKAAGSAHPMIQALGAEAERALAEAATKTGPGEAAAVLAAFLRSVEARLPIKKK